MGPSYRGATRPSVRARSAAAMSKWPRHRNDDCMGVASGCCYQEVGVANGSVWNRWVWLAGGGCGWNIWVWL